MSESDQPTAIRTTALALLAIVAVSAAILAACWLAPTEDTMGPAQRIVYVHVSVAWFGLVSFVFMAGTGLMYLIRRDLGWDHWSRAAAEIGWLCAGLTLLTGSFWAHQAWGTWWTWDPRLTTAFILWAMYSGYLVLRACLDDPHQSARLGAVLAILGALDVPLVVLATRWFRGIHPVAPEMEPAMRLTLLISIVGFGVFFLLLLVCRRSQLALENFVVSLEQKIHRAPESFERGSRLTDSTSVRNRIV